MPCSGRGKVAISRSRRRVGLLSSLSESCALCLVLTKSTLVFLERCGVDLQLAPSSVLRSQDCANSELMSKFRAGQDRCEINILGATYAIDFNQGLQTNQRTGTTRAIRCFFNVPIHWELTIKEAFDFLTPGANFTRTMQKVTDLQMLLRLQAVLNQSRARNDGSECWCAHGSSYFEVLEAFQIKNLYVWRRYQRFVRTVHEKHIQHGISPEECPLVSQALTNFAWDLQIDQTNNERLLLHGTRDLETAQKIALEGFDNRVRGRSSLYGQGTYFAAQTCKSAQYATANGPRHRATQWMMGTMLFARVAIGHPFYATGPCRERARISPQTSNSLSAFCVFWDAELSGANKREADVQWF